MQHDCDVGKEGKKEEKHGKYGAGLERVAFLSSILFCEITWRRWVRR